MKLFNLLSFTIIMLACSMLVSVAVFDNPKILQALGAFCFLVALVGGVFVPLAWKLAAEIGKSK